MVFGSSGVEGCAGIMGFRLKGTETNGEDSVPRTDIDGKYEQTNEIPSRAVSRA